MNSKLSYHFSVAGASSCSDSKHDKENLKASLASWGATAKEFMEAAAIGKPVHFLSHYILEKMIKTIKQSTIQMKSLPGDRECPEYMSLMKSSVEKLMKVYVEELNGSAKLVTYGNVLTEKLIH